MSLTFTITDPRTTELRALAASYGKTATGIFAKRTAPADAILQIYCPIGGAFGGVSAADFAEGLASVKDAQNLRVFISSEGGDFFEGVAIYAQLARFAETHNVTVHVDGLAASAASVIAMAAPRVVMAPNARIMIHEAWSGVMGTAKELIAAAELLKGVNDTMTNIYAGRTGQTPDAIRAMFAKGDTYMTASQAVELGFADAIEGEEEKRPAASAAPVKLTAQDTQRQIAAARIAARLHREQKKS